jgi:hypothetical protein
MSKELDILLQASKKHKATKQELEEQRRSFAYGNTHIENERITRQTVDRQAESLNTEANESGRAKT